ncbi:2-C-methyl-D-erythritol 4-phosphate cytidylyltransferase [Paludifilum halophilum]|uniref:2-C-methyl-D-erythritol 4-phosphate cytidylyltransferase n=1 Tax=Paludifilum halophilum TaxID=1642702 RepID=A0A235B2U1_9BACL|nr:2-C-methyl-D-erythritol 4-phosphate cytidylyltransferase [Paludifilum halophilum]OYD06561.1 2-C-methyl-D-erythritol 4-phosphate cytidylyltransferase [Paludifilum halophilum]
MKVGVVIPAAGKGRRMGTAVSKQFLHLAGVPVIIRTLRVFDTHPAVNRIVISVSGEEREGMKRLLDENGFSSSRIQVVTGGKERRQSVYNGLERLDEEWVMIHDAVRPFIAHDRIDALLEAVPMTGAAILAVPVKDTVKQVTEAGIVEGTPDRSSLWAVQTPQAFRRSLLMEAHQKGAEEERPATDDAMLVESLGIDVRVVQGDHANMKLTTPEDRVLAEAIWKMRSTDDD